MLHAVYEDDTPAYAIRFFACLRLFICYCHAAMPSCIRHAFTIRLRLLLRLLTSLRARAMPMIFSCFFISESFVTYSARSPVRLPSISITEPATLRHA